MKPSKVLSALDETSTAMDNLDTSPVALKDAKEREHLKKIGDDVNRMADEIEACGQLGRANQAAIDAFEHQCKEIQDLLEKTELRRTLILDRDAMRKERVMQMAPELEVI